MTIDDDLEETPRMPWRPLETEPVPAPAPAAQQRREELREKLRQYGLYFGRDSLADLRRLFDVRVPLGAADLEILQLSCRVRQCDVTAYLNDIASADHRDHDYAEASDRVRQPGGGDFDLPF